MNIVFDLPGSVVFWPRPSKSTGLIHVLKEEEVVQNQPEVVRAVIFPDSEVWVETSKVEVGQGVCPLVAGSIDMANSR